MYERIVKKKMDTTDKSTIKKGIFMNVIKSNLENYTSSYKGLHSEESQSLSYSQEEIEELSDNNANKDSISSISSIEDETKTTENTYNKNINEILYTFTWDEGGKNVKITGSFVNWSIQYDMIYNQEEKIFKYSHKLSKGKYSYKFIVDGVWKCSQKQQTIKDNSNNTNNFLDLSNYIIPIKPVKEKKSPKKKAKKKKEKKIIIKKKDRGYGIKFPTKDDLNIEAPVVQKDYVETFLINSPTNQNFIGRSQFLDYKTSEPFTEEKSYKELMMAPHISINHSLRSVDKLDLLETGIRFRFRDKNCTFVYYSHQPK